jgi:hypothetical protein
MRHMKHDYAYKQALMYRCPPPAPPIRLPEPEELPGGVRPPTDWPVRSNVQAPLVAAGPLSPVLGWVKMARVMLQRVCPSLHLLQTLLCAAFCAR